MANKPVAAKQPAKQPVKVAPAAAPAAAPSGGAAGAAGDIPDGVRAFLGTFARRLRQRNLHDLHSGYSVDWQRYSERHYPRSAWPNSESIADVVEEDENFLVLYRELTYRHIYRSLQPTVEDRVDSWQNYIELFNILLGLKSDAPEFELPLMWLYDIVDEFVYQFQNFHAFRSRKDLSEADAKFLKDEDNEHAWAAPTVLRYLHTLAKKGGLQSAAGSGTSLPASGSGDAKKDEKSSKKDDKEKEPASFFKALSQFSVIALCRVNCLLGDYTTALKSLDPIDLNSKRSWFTQVGGAYVSLHYYLTLAYLMTARYTDAVKTASGLLLWASRSSHDSSSASAVPRSAHRRIEQVYGLLALSTALSPQRLSDSLQTALREKFGDKLQRLQKMDAVAFEDLFLASAPKFVDPSLPATLAVLATPGGAAQLAAAAAAKKAADEKSAPAAAAAATGKDGKDGAAPAKKKEESDATTLRQARVLLTDVKQRAGLPDTVSYLKLCTSISVGKLASFCKADAPTTAQSLLNLKSKTRALRWRGGAPASGTVASNAEVDVAISKDVVLVSEYKAARRYGEYFIRQILQLTRLTDDINQIAA